jgi:predicted amino acid dehydrogenase
MKNPVSCGGYNGLTPLLSRFSTNAFKSKTLSASFTAPAAVPPIRKALERMNREVQVAEIASVVCAAGSVRLVFQRNADHLSIEFGEPRRVL